MATQATKGLMRAFPRRFGATSAWNSALVHTRRFYTGDRYQGYVSFFQPDELFGFVVRDDVPEREYYFHSTDLHTRNVPRVRPLQQVDFSIIEGRGGNFIAREITGPEGKDLEFNHPNMRLPNEERNRLLSQLPNGMHERHRGVVVTIHADGTGGFIIPDRLNFGAVNFRIHELQTTGAEKIERFSEVEFFVRPNVYEGARDHAICITRPGGGLITGERKEVAQRRRGLGAMYGPNDTQARVPPNYKEGRERGIVTEYFDDKLFGFIAPIDAPDTQGVFVHVDDCHISGKRTLRRNQLVEFFRVRDEETGRSKCMHVTGANGSVLHSISPNHYLPRDLTTRELEPSETQRRTGNVVRIDKNGRWFMIKPSERGYKNLFAWTNALQTLGRRQGVKIADLVEFTVEKNNFGEDSDASDEATNGKENEAAGIGVRATNVTAEGGFPILTQIGKYGKYLQSKINLPTKQSELEPAPLTDDVVTGYISGYNRDSAMGTVEVEAPEGKRYQKLKFTIEDCVLPENMDPKLAMLNVGVVVEVKVGENELNEIEKERAENGGATFSRRALNIVSPEMDHLQCREFREYGQDAQTGEEGVEEMRSKTLGASRRNYNNNSENKNRNDRNDRNDERDNQGAESRRRRDEKTISL